MVEGTGFENRRTGNCTESSNLSLSANCVDSKSDMLIPGYYVEHMIKSLFTGRIGIAQYWLSVLLLIALSIPFSIVIALLSFALSFAVISLAGIDLLTGTFIGTAVTVVVSSIAMFIIMLPVYGLLVRRYHDIGLSVWILVAFTIISWIVSFIFPIFTDSEDIASFSMTNLIISAPFIIFGLAVTLWPGTKGLNKYGEQTKYKSIWSALWGKQPEVQTTPAV